MSNSSAGRIEVTPRAVATLASEAVMECYGVVGMAAPNVVDGIAQLLGIESRHHGVEIHTQGDDISIELYVILQHGTRIMVVAQMIQQSVRFEVERALDRPIGAVNIHVQGLRMPF